MTTREIFHFWIGIVVLGFAPNGRAANLEPATVQAWDTYIDSAKLRMEQRLGPGKTFLWTDEAPDRLGRVRAGEMVVAPVGPQNPKHVPAGLIHDWVGGAFVPHASLNDVLDVARDYERYKDLYQPTVADSKALAPVEGKDRFSMLLVNRSFFVKTALETEYESCFLQMDDHRAYSISRATRIREVEEYGSPGQHFLSEGVGTGIIWRLFSISRYLERDGGVYFEFEAIGLSRDIPMAVRWLVEPIVHRLSRESLSISLQQTVNAVIGLHSSVEDHHGEKHRRVQNGSQ